jgi:glycosyltransferase involved in cell wall biosynthesis
MTIAEPTHVSVIVPVGHRQCDPEELYAEYKAPLIARGLPFEFIFVLDGPRPSFEAGLDRLAAKGESFTVIALTRVFGEATALMIGFEQATGDTILTLPAYLQIRGADINLLIDALGTADIAISHRHPRGGGWLERLHRRAFHSLLAFVTRVQFHDLGCNARAFTKKVLEEIRLYGEQQRFLPVLAERQGFRVQEVQVQPLMLGTRRDGYGPRTYTRALLDIFNIFFLVRFTKKPLRFFGMVGISLLAVGGLELAYLVFERIVLHHALADRPGLMLASLFIVLGVQIFALGLLGELIIFAHAGGNKDYKVERVTQFPNAPLSALRSESSSSATLEITDA